MHRVWAVGLCVAYLLLLRSVPGHASHEPFDVYEDWRAGKIRSDRWRGGEDFGGLEVRREVKGGKLQMRYRVEGGVEGERVTASGSDATAILGNFLFFVQPSAIDQVEVVFKIRRLKFTVCEANPLAETARAARILLSKFNDGTSGGPRDRTGDHIAGIQAQRDSNSADPAKILRVLGFLVRCANPRCSTFDIVSTAELAETVQAGEKFTLRLIWDQPNNQFLVGMNDNPDVPLPYTASDSTPAVGPFGFLGMAHNPANCTAGAAEADAETEVQEVRTNISAIIP